MTPACRRCRHWKRRDASLGTCWARGAVTVQEDESCGEFAARVPDGIIIPATHAGPDVTRVTAPGEE